MYHPDAICHDTLHPEDTHCVPKINALTLLVRNIYAAAAASRRTVPWHDASWLTVPWCSVSERTLLW